jgi:Co/Zn/Cd efflux system component
MRDCCELPSGVPGGQRRILVVILAVNAAMFVVELGAGLLAHSTALLADSADMLGDALVYGLSLYVVGRGPRWQARGALVKGAVMAVFALGVLAEASLKVVRDVVPAAPLMGGIGGLALGANAAVLALLWRHRGDDINMRSAWLCSRNDVIANAGVLIAAGAVAVIGSAWPDIVIGLIIAGIFATSAADVIGGALRAQKAATVRTT